MPVGLRKFRNYYQIVGESSDNGADAEPPREWELTEDNEGKYIYDPPHSPFGILREIAAGGPWTLRDVLHRMPWQTVLMMVNDRGKTKKRNEEDTMLLEDKDDVLGFVSELKQFKHD